MKLYSWNVNGIRAAQKKGFLDWLHAEQPDVLDRAGDQSLARAARSRIAPSRRAIIPGGSTPSARATAASACISKNQAASISSLALGIEKFRQRGPHHHRRLRRRSR